MPLLAQKILLVLVDVAPDDSAHAPALDAVAASGCSGFLRVSTSETTRSDLEILAGINRDEEGLSLAYPKLPLALFSTSPDACATFKAAGVACVRLLPASNSDSARQEVLALLAGDEDGDSTHQQLVVVHVEHAVTPTHWLAGLLTELLGQREPGGSGRFFIALVQPCASSALAPQAPLHPLRPRQSFAKRGGAYAPGPEEAATRRLLLSFAHHDHTRRDAVERFEAAHVDALGGGAYGSMGAHVFIQELAFRLGLAPKYGA